IGALTGEGDRDGGSDAGVRAGDQRPATAEPACAGVAVLTAIRAGDEFCVEARFGLILLRRRDVGKASGGVLEGQLVAHRLPPLSSVASGFPASRAQCEQQNSAWPSWTPWPRMRHPQCSQVGAALWIAHSKLSNVHELFPNDRVNVCS